MRAAWDANLVDPFFDDWDHLQSQMRGGVFDQTRAESYSFFEDAAGSMEGWYCFGCRADLDEEVDEVEEVDELPDEGFEEREEVLARMASYERTLDQLTAPAPKPVRADPKIGRNDPCPCGSGKKYKKCCGK